jgi:thiol-disulfide isomerase/thioredoxin
MRVATLCGLLCLVSALGIAGQEGIHVGDKLASVQLTDAHGKAAIVGLTGAITVVTFTSVQCPVSNAYNDRMSAVYKNYASKGVKFFYVNANSTESPDAVNAHASKHFPFSVYRDVGNVVADRLGATVTPESFVFDKDGALRYHGSLDDSQVIERVTERRLQTALDELMAGKAVAKAETKAFGCGIKRVR